MAGTRRRLAQRKTAGLGAFTGVEGEVNTISWATPVSSKSGVLGLGARVEDILVDELRGIIQNYSRQGFRG